MLWHFDPEHLSFAFVPVGQEFGGGVPVSRQQHRARANARACVDRKPKLGGIAVESAKDGA